MEAIDRFRGALIGLAVGDALGTTLEFKSPGSFKPIEDIIGGGPFGLQPGEWTDDTAMALCLAESLIQCHGFNATDQMQRYVRWLREGRLSSTGECFDIGSATHNALQRFLKTGDPYAGSTDPRTAGNGSLMRLAPVPLFFAAEAEQAIENSAESSRTTHAAPNAVDACRYYGALMVGAIQGDSKEELLCTICSARWLLGKTTAHRGHRSNRLRYLQGAAAPHYSWNRLRRGFARSGAVGFLFLELIPRRRSSRRQLGR